MKNLAYGYGGRPQGGSQRRDNFSPQEPAQPVKAETLPENYVDLAESIMQDLLSRRGAITTSKIRRLLSLVTEVYNAENLRTEEALLPESETALMMMRVRVAYEAGRDPGTKEFVAKAKLLQYLKGIGHSRPEMIRFAHYMEALVAYHRYFGGREN